MNLLRFSSTTTLTFNSTSTSKEKSSANTTPTEMLKSWLSAVCYTALSFAVFNGFCAADEWDAKVDEIMANFSNVGIVESKWGIHLGAIRKPHAKLRFAAWQVKLFVHLSEKLINILNKFHTLKKFFLGHCRQMTQIVSFNLINSTYQLDEDAVRDFAKHHVGSYLSAPIMTENDALWGWTIATFREFVGGIQQIAMEENGGHPMIYGVDSAHGSAMVTDTVYFGQQINGAATFNPDLLYEQGRITAHDTLAAGISWILDPVLDIMHNRCGRVCTRRSVRTRTWPPSWARPLFVVCRATTSRPPV